MVDLHCHILPDMDDGARDVRESLAMAQLALERGTTQLVATPHCHTDGAEAVNRAIEFLREQLQCVGLPLAVFPGMEIFADENTARLLQDGKLLTLGGSRYPLVEFAFECDERLPRRLLRQLVEAGYRPVVAHPERYTYIQQEPRLLNDWLDMGCLLQLNKGSFSGQFGPRCQALAFSLVARGYAAVISSDGHGFDRRTPTLDRTWDLICQDFSPRAAEMLLQENPRRILRNFPIPAPRLHRF
ncbi:MAG: hypothetical protein IKU07_02245 [Oscillospiraceae bacterium]|nr:hypothetical protein [Oscillospiraceae bacterium]